MNNDEYIDYSCSTPLERLSRDVQTLLRSWHIISGSDRHVSFHRKQPRPNLTSARSVSVPTFSVFDDDDSEEEEVEAVNTDEEGGVGGAGGAAFCGLGLSCGTRPFTAPLGSVGESAASSGIVSSPGPRPTLGGRPSLLGLTPRRSPLRSSASDRNLGSSRPSPLRSPNRRRSDENTTPTGTPTNPYQSVAWDGGGGGVKLIRSGKLTLTTTPPNSSHRPQDRITVQLDLRLWDGPSVGSNRSEQQTPTPPSSSSSLTTSTLPLSLRTYRDQENGHKEVVEQEDIISNLSSLLGIGQHLTLTPSDEDNLDLLLDSTVDALLRLNHPSGKKCRSNTAKKMRSPADFLFKSSDIANTNNNTNGKGTSSTAFNPTTTSSSTTTTTVLGTNPQDHVAIHSAALHSLSTQLQMALNIALGECDCRIPAFGIWGLYQPSSSSSASPFSPFSSDSNNNNNNTTTTSNGTEEKYDSNGRRIRTTRKREYLMSVPDWMNGGGLVELAEESSPCFALIRYLKDAEEEEKMRRMGGSGRGGLPAANISESDSQDDDDKDDPGGGSGRGDAAGSTTARKSNNRRRRRSKPSSSALSNNIPPGGLIHNALAQSLSITSSTNSNQNPQHSHQQKRGWGGFGGGDGSGSGRKDRLYLPAFLMGYCHSGPGILAKGATFAIHVVPAGIAYPIHCTTLNSLGQLLLQHCPPPSVVPGIGSGGCVASPGVSPVFASSGNYQTLEDIEAAARVREEAMAARDLSFYGKVEVVWARHKYTWSKLFEFQQFTNGFSGGGNDSGAATAGSCDDLNVLTYNMPWRKCCDSDVISEFSDVYGDVDDDNGDVDRLSSSSRPSTAILEYQRQCRIHAIRMIHRIMTLTKSKGDEGESNNSNSTAKKEFEPLWGPVNDPILSVSITVTWCSHNDNDDTNSGQANTNQHSNNRTQTSPTPSIPRERNAPFLTLPLRIRSQRTMSSQDVLEMENTLLSTIFNPLTVPRSDFSVHITPDPYSRCNSLGANNRCILAALIRVSTLDHDALLGNLTKSTVLRQMHERKVGDSAAADLMRKARVGSVTQKLVEIMDWSSMAGEVSDTDWEFEEKLDAIVKDILYSGDMRGYPNPPEGGKCTASFGGGGMAFEFQRAEAPGRLLSVLFSCMSGLRWPSAMARLWLKFVAELRLRWEDKISLQNLGRVPGLDTFDNGRAGGGTGGGQQFKTIGHSAKFAAFVNSSEPNPNQYSCLISQKLQVFNIGVETMIVKEEEEYRRHLLEEEARLKNSNNSEDDDDQDGDEADNKICCAQSEAATEVIGNTCDGVNRAGMGNTKFTGINEEKDWCAQSEAATEVRGNAGSKMKPWMGDSQVTATNTTVSGGNSCSILSPGQPFRSMYEIEEDEDSASSSHFSDPRNVPMMFDPHENKFKPIEADNNTGDIILNHHQPDVDMQSSSTGTDFYDAFTTIETNTYDNKSRYAVSSNGGLPEIEDDFDYEFPPFEEAAVSVANRIDRKGIRCPVHGAYLVASSDQVYAPYLQRPDPITDELILERRNLLTAALRYSSSSTSIKSRLEVAHRFEKAKLLSDMSAFKAANPGAVFHDFVLWYGNPQNPLQLYDDEIEDFISSESLLSPDRKCELKEAEDAAFVLDQTRDFWSDTWDEAEPIPASEQIPLFDAFSTVEMILLSFEDMHPAQLLNQILSINFAMADFILSSSKPVYQLDLVDCALKQLSRKTEQVLKMLNKDLLEDLKRQSPKAATDVGDKYSFSHITPETVAACESLCGQIGSVESMLSRAASLLTKFSGDVNLVRQVLENSGRHYAATSHESRSGILNGIQCQQQRNSGSSTGAMDELPFPSVREYVLRNRDDCNPCQLTVSIGGTHGLEKGGTNSTKGGLVLALNKCVSGAQ